MNRDAGIRCFVAIGLVASPSVAFAGAWTLDAGQGQAIVTATPSEANKVFDQNGSQQQAPRYSKDEVQSLVEYGASDWLTVMMSPSLQHVSIAPPYEGQRTGLGYTDLGARVRLASGDSWILSTQTTLNIPGTFSKTNPAAIGYYDPEVDIRGLFGYSFVIGRLPAFVDVEAAQRIRVGGPPNEFRADATFGIKPLDRWLVLLQSFNVVSEGAGGWGLPSYAYYKLQLSAVYELTPAVSVGLGAFTTYAGRNALQEQGLVASIWYKF